MDSNSNNSDFFQRQKEIITKIINRGNARNYDIAKFEELKSIMRSAQEPTMEEVVKRVDSNKFSAQQHFNCFIQKVDLTTPVAIGVSENLLKYTLESDKPFTVFDNSQLIKLSRSIISQENIRYKLCDIIVLKTFISGFYTNYVNLKQDTPLEARLIFDETIGMYRSEIVTSSRDKCESKCTFLTLIRSSFLEEQSKGHDFLIYDILGCLGTPSNYGYIGNPFDMVLYDKIIKHDPIMEWQHFNNPKKMRHAFKYDDYINSSFLMLDCVKCG